MEILRFLAQIEMESGNCNSKYKRTIRSKKNVAQKKSAEAHTTANFLNNK
jgi:hypothetical protein